MPPGFGSHCAPAENAQVRYNAVRLDIFPTYPYILQAINPPPGLHRPQVAAEDIPARSNAVIIVWSR